MVALATLLISHAVMLRLRSVDGVREERERGATPKKFTQVCSMQRERNILLLAEAVINERFTLLTVKYNLF